MSANSIKPSGAAIRFRAAIAAGAAALALLLVSATSAMAAYDHSDYVGKFPVANECMNVTDIAVL
jgi:hypothetical protein